jgi:hypothetical protein
MSEMITIHPDQLQAIVDIAVNSTLTAVGIKPKDFKPYMSKAQAGKMVGRKRIESAIRKGVIIAKYSDTTKKTGRVYVSRADVIKLVNNPLK